MAGLAEFERELIRARTGEGRARAVANGVKMGRKPKLTPHQKREAIRRRDRGEESLAEIGRSYNVSGWTISRLTPTRAALKAETSPTALPQKHNPISWIMKPQGQKTKSARTVKQLLVQ